MKNTRIKFMKDGNLSREIEVIDNKTCLIEYDEYGNITYMKNDKLESNSIIVDGKSIFDITKYNNGDIDTVSMVYDERGNIIRQNYVYFNKETGKDGYTIITNKYDNKDRCIQSKVITPEGVTSNTVIYEDNKEIIIHDDNNKEIFTLDENGRCIKIESNGFEEIMEYANNNLIYHKSSFLEEDESWSHMEYWHSYNEHGDIIHTKCMENGKITEDYDIDVIYIEE